MKIAVLVSGGVDSAVSLALLKNQGYQVHAFYLKIWLEDELSSLASCPWEEDVRHVEAICTQLGVPLQIISLQEQYWGVVVKHTIAAVKAGLTPNPDIWCNQYIKFGAFFDVIDDSFDKVATGHYAQVAIEDGLARLHRAPDPIKDQTYFLCNLNQEQLKRAMFPIGHLQKSQVRALAETFALSNKDRKDSQGICFLGKFKFSEFLEQHLGTLHGDIVDYQTGKTLGQHRGHWFYTIGQRQGICLSDGPWYVASKDPAANKIFVSNTYDVVDAPRQSFTVSSVRWLSKAPEHFDQLLVKIRHRATPQPCTFTVVDEHSAHITLAQKDQGIAPGQSAVFYVGTQCLGAGIIK